MTERCGACGTDGVTNSTGRFVTSDWLRASELKTKLDELRAQTFRARNLIECGETAAALNCLRDAIEKVGSGSTAIKRPNRY